MNDIVAACLDTALHSSSVTSLPSSLKMIAGSSFIPLHVDAGLLAQPCFYTALPALQSKNSANTSNALIEAYNEIVAPFVWTKSKVH
jgi:hypothetical protein